MAEYRIERIVRKRLEHPEYALATAKGRYHYAGLLFLKFLAEFSSPDLGRLPHCGLPEQDSDWRMPVA